MQLECENGALEIIMRLFHAAALGIMCHATDIYRRGQEYVPLNPVTSTVDNK